METQETHKNMICEQCHLHNSPHCHNSGLRVSANSVLVPQMLPHVQFQEVARNVPVTSAPVPQIIDVPVGVSVPNPVMRTVEKVAAVTVPRTVTIPVSAPVPNPVPMQQMISRVQTQEATLRKKRDVSWAQGVWCWHSESSSRKLQETKNAHCHCCRWELIVRLNKFTMMYFMLVCLDQQVHYYVFIFVACLLHDRCRIVLCWRLVQVNICWPDEPAWQSIVLAQVNSGLGWKWENL